jgi:hypothetical protein
MNPADALLATVIGCILAAAIVHWAVCPVC